MPQKEGFAVFAIKTCNNRNLYGGGGKPFLLPISALLLLAATLSGCGPTGTITYTGFPLKNKGLSAAAENGVLKSVQFEIVSPGEQCANGGVKLVNTSNTSETPVFVCGEADERIYRVTNTDVSALPATGTLVPCSNDAETGCLASGNFKVVNSTQLDATKIATGTTVAGIVGAAVLESHVDCAADGQFGCVATSAFKSADVSAAVAANIRVGIQIAGVSGSFNGAYSACTSDGQTGCISDASFKAVDMTKLTAGNLKNGVSIAGTTGTYPSASTPLANDTGTADLTAFNNTTAAGSYEFFDSAGNRYAATLADQTTVTPTTTAQNITSATQLYRSVAIAGDANLVAGKILSGQSIFGVAGNVTAESHSNCAADGSTGCVATASYTAVDMTKLIAGNIKKDVSIAGVTGAYPSAAFKLAGDTGTADLPAFASTVGGSSYEWFTADGTLLSGTIMADQNVTPGTATQNFNGGLYRSVSVAGDADLTAANIANGVQIFSVTGTAALRPADCATDGATNCVSVAAYKAAETSGLASKILSGQTVAGVAGNVTLPAAAAVRSGTTFGPSGATSGSIDDCSANGTVGCYTTSGYKSADFTNITAGNIKNGVVAAGVTGTYPSATTPLASNTVATDLTAFNNTTVAGSYEFFDSAGNRYAATLADQSTVTPTTTAQNITSATQLYRSVSIAGDANLVAGKILSGNSIFGVAGNVTAESHSNCAADGATNCVAVAGFTAANTTGLAPKIIAGNSVAGIPGTYTPPGVLDVKNGVTFGITGSLLTGTYPSAGNLLAGSSGTDLPGFASTVTAGTYQFFKSDGTRVTGSITDAGTVTPSTGTQTFSTSLYKGFGVAAVNNSIDGNIIAGNIKSGVTILGVTGSVTQEAHSTCTSDAQTGCVTDANYKAAKMANFSAGNVQSGVTIAGVAGGATIESHNACTTNGVGTTGACYTTDAYKSFDYVGLTAGNIKSGVTIGGIAGTYSAAFNTLIGSGAHRNQTATQMTYAQELGLGASVIWRTITSGNTGYGYREVPLIAKDDDGYTASTNAVVKLTRPSAGQWGGTTTDTRKVCGKSATSVADKITNCETHNGNATPWNGAVNGISGEGSWTLVTVYSAAAGDVDGTTCGTAANTCYEVWRDDRTGLLWSDKLEDSAGAATTYNWCHASGNSNATGVNASYREADPSGYCNSGTYQNQTNPISLCFEDTGFTTSTALDPMKGNMHKHSGSATVKWRLPTRHDFEIAEHNGIRHVLPNMASYFWSASVVSFSRNSAWRFYGGYGNVYNVTRFNTSGVRCVGGE